MHTKVEVLQFLPVAVILKVVYLSSVKMKISNTWHNSAESCITYMVSSLNKKSNITNQGANVTAMCLATQANLTSSRSRLGPLRHPEWPRWIAHLHRSAGGRLLSERIIWSNQLLLGSPGGRFQVRSGRCPREMSIWCWRAWCSGVSFQSLAIRYQTKQAVAPSDN